MNIGCVCEREGRWRLRRWRRRWQQHVHTKIIVSLYHWLSVKSLADWTYNLRITHSFFLHTKIHFIHLWLQFLPLYKSVDCETRWEINYKIKTAAATAVAAAADCCFCDVLLWTKTATRRRRQRRQQLCAQTYMHAHIHMRHGRTTYKNKLILTHWRPTSETHSGTRERSVRTILTTNFFLFVHFDYIYDYIDQYAIIDDDGGGWWRLSFCKITHDKTKFIKWIK